MFDRVVRGSSARWVVAGLVLASLVAAGCGSSKSTTGSSNAHKGGAVGTRRAKCHPNRALVAFIRRDFKRIDRNGNRMIDAREARSAMVGDFRAMDVNHDGVVTLKDVRQSVKPGAAKPTGPVSHYLPYDANGDGRITEAEYVRTIHAGMFDRMDKNHDGRISLAEALAFPPRSIRVRCT